MATLQVREGSSEGSHGGEVFSCVYSADGAFVLSGGWDGYLRLWITANGQAVSSLQASVRPLSCVAFSPGGSAWLTAAMDGTLNWWDAMTHQMKQGFIAHIRPISALEFSPDGQFLATASWDRKLCLRRVGDEREGRMLVGHGDIVAGCRWTHDSKQLLSWSHDGTLRLWSADTGREVARLAGHGDRVTAACLSKDGQWAISGSRDGSIKVWNLQHRAEARLVQLREEIRGCWCLGNGTSLVTIDANGWMMLWSLPDLEVQTQLETNIRVLSGDISPLGNEIVLGSEKGTLHFVTIDGVEISPLVVTSKPLFKPKSGVITRFLGKQKIERAYQYCCPACGHTAETPSLPSEAIPCPSCNRLLRVCAEAEQLQPQ